MTTFLLSLHYCRIHLIFFQKDWLMNLHLSVKLYAFGKICLIVPYAFLLVPDCSFLVKDTRLWLIHKAATALDCNIWSQFFNNDAIKFSWFLLFLSVSNATHLTTPVSIATLALHLHLFVSLINSSLATGARSCHLVPFLKSQQWLSHLSLKWRFVTRMT